jgi:uncharacterized UBP type Zn finger protein
VTETRATGGCEHLDLIQDVTPSTDGCEECLQMGDRWFHLRTCLICGHVGCCDQSRNKHATKHFHDTAHPVMKSAQPGESWLWCYVDELMFEIADPRDRLDDRGVADE